MEALGVRTQNGCLEWGGHRLPNGYGYYSHRYVHRLSYEINFGDIPPGMLVCHKCDNPPCFEPSHLFVGTHKDNAQDCVRKGRNSRPPRHSGETHRSARLTEADVREIRRQRDRYGIKFSELARVFGVKKQAVRAAAIRKTWRHVV